MRTRIGEKVIAKVPLPNNLRGFKSAQFKPVSGGNTLLTGPTLRPEGVPESVHLVLSNGIQVSHGTGGEPFSNCEARPSSSY